MSKSAKTVRDVPPGRETGARLPISALLSQVLVAFTVEFDNEFEREMMERGYPGARLSWVIWASLFQFAAEGEISVADLAARALAPQTRMTLELGCLERWGFVVLESEAGGGRSSRMKREGWGSGRGIRPKWRVRLTASGREACAIWPPLFGQMEERWQKRFGGEDIGRLRQLLQVPLSQIDVELPLALPPDWAVAGKFPSRASHRADDLSPSNLPLLTLFSQALLVFAMEFDRESKAPLALCANVLRVLGEKPEKIAEIPRLTGASPERSAIGWQLKPYVVVEADAAGGRGKVARLTPAGLKAQAKYHQLTAEIEGRWRVRFGASVVDELRESLLRLVDARGLLSKGMEPPPGIARAGDAPPALGRRSLGPAAQQRGRDLVAQTEAFVRDPAGSLPHYPLWDMNRGFGP